MPLNLEIAVASDGRIDWDYLNRDVRWALGATIETEIRYIGRHNAEQGMYLAGFAYKLAQVARAALKRHRTFAFYDPEIDYRLQFVLWEVLVRNDLETPGTLPGKPNFRTYNDFKVTPRRAAAGIDQVQADFEAADWNAKFTGACTLLSENWLNFAVAVAVAEIRAELSARNKQAKQETRAAGAPSASIRRENRGRRDALARASEAGRQAAARRDVPQIRRDADPQAARARAERAAALSASRAANDAALAARKEQERQAARAAAEEARRAE